MPVLSRRLWLSAVASIWLVVCMTLPVKAEDYTFTYIDVPGSEQGGTTSTGISNEGAIVGYYNLPNGEGGYTVNGFLDIAGSYTTVDVPGATGTLATGINDSGEIVGDYIDASGNLHNFIDNGGSFTTIDISCSGCTYFYGVNDNGDIVGATAGPPLFTSYAIAGGFLDSGGNLTAIGVDTAAQGINNDGEIVGINFGGCTDGGLGCVNTNAPGFIYSDGVFTSIAVPSGIGTDPFGVNDEGGVVGGYTESDDTVAGFLDSDGVFTTFNPDLGPATGINDSGDILFEEYVATPSQTTPVPEPSSLAILIPGVIGLLPLRRQRA